MSIFHFKQFVIDQEGCPMKINTDGVLLGAMCNVSAAKRILDIGTGTGVIALMIAQRNREAFVDAIDVDYIAYDKSKKNFENSLFHSCLKAHHHSFKEFFDLNPLNKYNLIVSNPPYFLNALQSPKASKNISKHTNEQFFLDLLLAAKNHLTDNGNLELVLPVDISLMLQNTAQDYGLYANNCIKINSYPDKAHIRHIISFSKQQKEQLDFQEFCIYESQGIHSLQYKTLLKDFFKIF
ncbi:tRNA1(Val) (adenine(37)-N6)-methyltransferase [Pedobacter alpinus]|uniref:tRNA1(Val) (adenine(37)-N6)-methyltransferase n=1 Tax=Pedobacter alpinus TaxID=1590643 RepID=A0ABW5TSX8_9SPHI